MHVYSSDNEFRSTFLAILGGLAFVVVYALNAYVFPWLYQQIPFEIPPLIVSGLPFGLVFGLFRWLFDRRLWNKFWISDFIVALPNLTGHWKGKTPDNYLAADGQSWQ